jgi:arylsulfatase A-like enzyme
MTLNPRATRFRDRAPHNRPIARTKPTDSGSPVAAARRSAAVTVLWLGFWWALLGALAETLAVGSQILCFGYAYLGSLQMHRYAFSAIGVSDLVLLGGAAIGLAGLVFAFPGERTIRIGFWVQAVLAAMAPLFVFRSLSTISATLLALGIATCLVRTIQPDGPRYRRFVVRSYPMLLLVPIGLAAWQVGRDRWQERAESAPPAPPGRPNILLIVLDTVPADALSCYGYGRPTTPNLDRLAGRGIRFTHASAPGTWTLPSHSSMFTGRWPHELSARIDRPLDDSFPTLAEELIRRGYATAGFVANAYFCNSWQGVARGFAYYADTPLELQTVLRSSAIGRKLVKSLGLNGGEVERQQAVFGRKDALEINHEFLEWLDRYDHRRPFFAFLNYFDAHDPYLLEDEPQHPFGLRPQNPRERRLLRDWHTADIAKVTPRQIELARDCYDDCLAELDRGLARLLAALDQRGLAETTWIVVTSDHGEQFGEHGLFGHGNSLHRQVTHVPLLVIPPTGTDLGSPRVIETPVSLRDLPATVLDLIDGEPGMPFPGSSLRPLWDRACHSGNSTPVSPAVSEIVDRDEKAPPNWVPGGSLTADGWTYIRSVEGQEALYDLRNDPSETTNLAARPDHAAQLARTRALLDTVVPSKLK